MIKKTIRNILPFVLMLGFFGTDASNASILNTKHNLSVSGPGEIKATAETQICIFCHTPHQGRRDIPYLWNRQNQTVSYIPYQSSTLFATVGQPTGASKMCLSCHDGTIALGALLSEPAEVPFKGGIRFLPAGSPARLGNDLSDDHPVSFVFDTSLAQRNPELAFPSLLPPEIQLDGNGQLQCTACHDPHDNKFGKFLVMSNQFSDLCTACHDMNGWPFSSHAISNAQWNGQGTDPWPTTDFQTVAQNGCENCHRPHTAGRPERLLKHLFEEDNCLVCHNGNVASTNIESELSRQFGHFVQNFVGAHEAAEDFSFGGVPNHVECEDCHNPHEANGDSSIGAPRVSGANAGVTGIDSGGIQVDRAQNLYEICFKCHADNNVINALPITRQIDQLNTRLEFDLGNPSFHPVESVGVNPDVPSLLQPFTRTSIISCTDCHNSDDPNLVQGPHGSSFRFLLERNYETLDFTQETSSTYALCYKCHSRSSILNDESFSEHNKHIVEENTPCSICHDPHGISSTQGNSFNNSHLINFDLTVVRPDGQGRIQFEDLGRLTGQCFLNCHGEEHSPEGYPGN
jgi:predicted CXXCH cytochrome family protein